MQYALLGQSGLVVSRLAFGSMTFGTGEFIPGVNNHVDQGEADRMVARAIEAGVNLFDSADAYCAGDAEVMLGKALKGKRDQVVISTKVGHRMGSAITARGLSRHNLVQAAEASLKRLGTDHIDLYQFHIPDPFTPVEETLRGLEDLIASGKVRYGGFSNFTAWRAASLLGTQKRLGYSPFAVAQMYYSLLGRDLEHECIPFYQDAGIGLLAWGPLAGGYLSGKYTQEEGLADDARRQHLEFPPVDPAVGDKAVHELRRIGKASGATAAQVAIAWILANPAVTSVIVGASRMSQLEQNLGATEIALSADDLQALNALTQTAQPYPVWMEPMGADPTVAQALGQSAGATVVS